MYEYLIIFAQTSEFRLTANIRTASGLASHFTRRNSGITLPSQVLFNHAQVGDEKYRSALFHTHNLINAQ